MTDNKLRDLVAVSKEIGRNVAYIQGGGGNTSVKFDDARMAVKASGCLLKDMSLSDGLSVVDYEGMVSYIAAPAADDNVFNEHIRSLVIAMSDRPSMETGCHALLNKFVIHTHSVYVNLLTCSVEGTELSKSLFPDASWLPYITPGRDLTVAIRDLVEQEGTPPKAIFLKNHGLMVSAETARAAYDIHEEINQKIRDAFGLAAISSEMEVHSRSIDYIRSHILFPDQVVYTQASSKLLRSQAAKETLWAYNYILDNIEDLGLTADFLAQDRAGVLLGLDSEKHRQSVTKI